MDSIRGRDPNCSEGNSNLIASNLTPATVVNLCSAESFITSHELISSNSVELNAAASLSDDSGVPLTTNSSISSGDSYRFGMCRLEMELVESDGEVSQLDSLDNCSEGGMSAENFNTLKKGPLAPIEPPPEFQDSPHTTLVRCVSKNIFSSLTRWSSSQSLFDKKKDIENISLNSKQRMNKGEKACFGRGQQQTNFKDLYSSDIILNTNIDNIYDEPSDIINTSFAKNSNKPVTTAMISKALCPYYKDHTRYFRAIPSEHDYKISQMSTKLQEFSEVHNYEMYYDLKKNFINSNQFDNSLQMKVLCSPLNHHYHANANNGNRPNSRNSLSSRLSSSHNSLNVSSANKPDDSIFITQAMSHDALITREISDFYNVPIDSDIYAFPIDMIQTGSEKISELHTFKEISCKSEKPNRQKCFRSNKRRKRNSNIILNNCSDEHIFDIDRKLNKPKQGYKTVALALSWEESDTKKDASDPIEMTVDGTKQFYHTYYSGPKVSQTIHKATISEISTESTSHRLTGVISMKMKPANDTFLLTEKEKSLNKNCSPVILPIKFNTNMDINNIQLIDKTDNINNNNTSNNNASNNNQMQNTMNQQGPHRDHRNQQHHLNKLTLQSEKKSQFTLNLKQKFCSIFRFRKSHSRCQENSTHSADYISNRNRTINNEQFIINDKSKKFQSRALPPLPNKTIAGQMSLELEEKEIKKELRAFHFTSSIEKVKDYGWYWGPLSSEAAEKVLSNEPDGSFIVRDSSDDHYIFSLSFKLNNCVRHVRIEQDQGTFSFGSYAKFKSQTITEFIEKAVEHSRSGRYLFFLHRRPEHGPLRVQLTNPVSRFKHIQSLQHLCRFIILKAVVRKDLIQTLPLPRRLLDYLNYKHCYSEQIESDGSQSQMSEDGL